MTSAAHLLTSTRLAGLDFESTGKDPETARAVTCCVAFVGGGDPAEVRSWLVNPGMDIPAEATEVHGVTTEHARDHGRHPKEVIREIAGQLRWIADAGLLLTVYNAPYDLTLFDRELRRHAPDLLSWWDVALPSLVVVDPLVIDKHIDRYRPGSRKLGDTCQVYDVRHDGAHDSTEDTLAACRLAWQMGRLAQAGTEALTFRYADRKYPRRIAAAWGSLAQLTARELHDAQADWYRDQAENFSQYLHQQGNEAQHRADNADNDEARTIAKQEADELHARADDVTVDWPIRPWGGEVA